MSEIAKEYVRALLKKGTGPDGKPIVSAEARVLKVLSYLHNEFVWCAWPQMDTIAEGADMSKTNARKICAQLEARGVLKRYAATSDKYGSSTSNEYEFVELGEHQVSQQTRDMIFKYQRTRSAVQLSLRRGGRQRRVSKGPNAGPTPGEQSDQGSYEHVEKSVDVVAPGNRDGCPPQPPWLPVELYGELYLDSPSPYPFLGTEQRGKAAQSEQRQERATASASARATTSPVQVPEAAGNVLPFRQREFRPARVPPEADGISAAVRAAAAKVLTQCGVIEDGSTRRTRNAVTLAMAQQYLALDGEDETLLAVIGECFIERWTKYQRDAELMWRPVGIRKFFALGMWRDPDAWPYRRISREEVDRERETVRRNRARIGMR